jgi:hypothetical protein
MGTKLPLIVSPGIEAKLAGKVPPVTIREVEQCFENRVGGLLTDTREDHKTDPPTMWFLAETNAQRLLKVVYVQKRGFVYLKTAYDPNAEEKRIYQKFA